MSPTTEQLLNSALALPEPERIEFVDALLAQCASHGVPELDDAWLAEIRRRSAEIDAGTATLTPWPEVKRRVRQRLEGRNGG